MTEVIVIPRAPIQRSRYLGDGLYADFDGWHYRLYTERENGVHEVFLEPATLHAFLEFIGLKK